MKAAAVALAAVVLLGACEDPQAGGTARHEVTVTCSSRGASVSGATVAASSDGVHLRVTRSAPAGTYLNVLDNVGGFGDAAPRNATWVRSIPPGKVKLSCSKEAGDYGRSAALTVVDPDRNWRKTTLADLGCPPGQSASWVIGPATGATPEVAVNALIAGFAATNRGPLTGRRAPIGYPDDRIQTWLLSHHGEPSLTATVDRERGRYVASPDQPC